MTSCITFIFSATQVLLEPVGKEFQFYIGHCDHQRHCIACNFIRTTVGFNGMGTVHLLHKPFIL